MSRKLAIASALLLGLSCASAQVQVPIGPGVGGGSSGGGSPTGAAGGLLSGTYPNPGLALGQLTNSLGADVALNATSTYKDGPSVAQGATGTWFASGSVTLFNSSSDTNYCKLWDGTTIIDSGGIQTLAGTTISGHFSGMIASPAGNIRISCEATSTTTGNIKANNTGNNKDSTLTVFRIQ